MMYEKIPLKIKGVTLPFYTYVFEDISYIEFDASACQPPEPMFNVMRGLELIAGSDKRLVMINAYEPTPLYPRIADSVVWDVTVLENGDVKIVFRIRD